jgi:hypothetical protein
MLFCGGCEQDFTDWEDRQDKLIFLILFILSIREILFKELWYGLLK